MPQKYENEIEDILQKTTSIQSSHVGDVPSQISNRILPPIASFFLNFVKTKLALKIGLISLILAFILHLLNQSITPYVSIIGIFFLVLSYVLWFQKPSITYQKKWRGEVIEAMTTERTVAKLKRWLS